MLCLKTIFVKFLALFQQIFGVTSENLVNGELKVYQVVCDITLRTWLLISTRATPYCEKRIIRRSSGDFPDASVIKFCIFGDRPACKSPVLGEITNL